MEIIQISPVLFANAEFKIDLIVWKFVLFPPKCTVLGEFKIDLIVWKLRFRRNFFEIGDSLK